VDQFRIALQETAIDIDAQVYLLEYNDFSSLVLVEEAYRVSSQAETNTYEVGLWMEDFGMLSIAGDLWERRSDLTGVSFVAGIVSVSFDRNFSPIFSSSRILLTSTFARKFRRLKATN